MNSCCLRSQFCLGLHLCCWHQPGLPLQIRHGTGNKRWKQCCHEKTVMLCSFHNSIADLLEKLNYFCSCRSCSWQGYSIEPIYYWDSRKPLCVALLPLCHLLVCVRSERWVPWPWPRHVIQACEYVPSKAQASGPPGTRIRSWIKYYMFLSSYLEG